MRGVLAAVLAVAMLSAVAVPLMSPSTVPTPSAGPMKLWEAYARGNVTITQVDITWDPGSGEISAPIGYRVSNRGAVPVVIDEPAMLLSPHPLQTWDPSQATTQDGVLTNWTIPAGSSVTFSYAEFWMTGVLPSPPWWCTEEFQYTKAGVSIYLGGEILPNVLQSEIAHWYYNGPNQNTQADLWNFVKSFPSLVVGKTPLWRTLPNAAGQVVDITLAATNIAVTKADDQYYGEVDAHNAIVLDTVPAGWTVVPGSYTLAPTSTTDNPDGTKTVKWTVDLPAANVTGRDRPADKIDPSPYHSVKIRYKLLSPRLPEGRVELPRAEVDFNHDGSVDAHSAVPVLDVYRVNEPPNADAGGPYAGTEGSPITFNAGGSSDPDNDSLTYRWDITADGTWDTPWSSSPLATFTYPDDFSGRVRVQVSDGSLTDTAEATVSIANVAPTVNAGSDRVGSEGTPMSFVFSFSDPGYDSPAMGTVEDFTATINWGYGQTQGVSVLETPGGPGVPTTGVLLDASGGLTHLYGDDGVFTVTVTVCDDDGGCGSDTAVVSVGNLPPTFDYTVTPDGAEGDSLTFIAHVTDPGSDDLTVAWSGSCTGWSAPTTYPNDPARFPDPDPSPEVNPRDVTDTQTVTCGDNGLFSWRVEVTDDDGGYTILSGTFTISNLPPSLTSAPSPPRSINEGEALTLSASASDPGSDDLTFAWAWEYLPTDTHTYYNDGVGPDPAGSPNGTYPFSASDASSATYGDNGVYGISLTVTDDDGGSITYTTSITVNNVPPTVDGVADQATDEGSPLSFAFTFSDPGFDFPPAGTVEDFTAHVDWGDGTWEAPPVDEVPGGPGVPTTGTIPVGHVYADNGVYAVLVRVCDDDGGCGNAAFSVTVNNVAPTVDAGADGATVEASPLSFTFSFSDPGFDFPPMGTVEDFTATIDWGYGPLEDAAVTEVPGGPGVPTTGTIEASHVYGDNGVFTVTVTVCDDDGGCGTDAITVTVDNVAPTMGDVQAYVVANLTLRVAGERWHDVCMDILHDGNSEGRACVVRYPGSPDRQSATITGRIELRGDFRIVLYYTPDDDPVNGQPNGANPAWVIITFPDGSEVRLHHTFNVQHPDTWVWTLEDLRPHLVGRAITYEGTASDVGSDDLTFTWDFGDGTAASATHFNDGVGPDPYPSPEVNPITATDLATHAFARAGTYTIALTVTDDDGGTTVLVFEVSVG